MWGNNRQHERETRSAEFENHRRGRDLAFLLAGIGIGSGVALLLAPDSGEEIRHAIGRRYHKTVKRISRHTEDLRERAEDLLERAQELRERGERLLHRGRGGETLRRVA
jgi:YtxH-like protein